MPRIVRSTEGVSRTIRHPISDITVTRPGILLEMADGSVWFHPYSGAAPIREK